MSTNPSSASGKTGVSSAKWENKGYNTGKVAGMGVLPQPFGVLFQIHGSKLKLHPVSNLSQASVSGISHPMLLFGICKDTLNRLFSGLVHPLVNRGIAGIVGQFFVVFPDVSGDCFYTVLTLCA